MIDEVEDTRGALLFAQAIADRATDPQVQLGARKHGLRVDSLSGDLATRDAELVAHAEFRKQLYSYDVVPLARRATSPGLPS